VPRTDGKALAEARARMVELEAALGDARADSRAARDEVGRLNGEADQLRAQLDEALTASAPEQVDSAGHGGDAALQQAHAALHAKDEELARLRAEVERDRRELRARSEEAARTWGAQLAEAHAASAQSLVELHRLRSEMEALRAEVEMHRGRQHGGGDGTEN
jgi:chromosome segregation ATPase